MRTFFYRYGRRRQDGAFTFSEGRDFGTTLKWFAEAVVNDTQSGFRVRVVVCRAARRAY